VWSALTAGTENVERTAIAVEDRFLGFVHDELRAELDLGTPLRGNRNAISSPDGS